MLNVSFSRQRRQTQSTSSLIEYSDRLILRTLWLKCLKFKYSDILILYLDAIVSHFKWHMNSRNTFFYCIAFFYSIHVHNIHVHNIIFQWYPNLTIYNYEDCFRITPGCDKSIMTFKRIIYISIMEFLINRFKYSQLFFITV